MAVPYTFASATSAIPLSQLDANFATTITLGNTAIQLGNTVTTLNNMTMANATVSSGNVTVTSASLSGNLTFTGTGNRITGDFSNATAANRVTFQTSTANSATIVGVIPNGTSTNAQLWCFGSSDPANTSVLQLAGGANTNTEVRIASNITGTGTYLPMTFYTGGSERMRIDTSGNVGIGTSSPTAPITVVTPSGGLALQINGRSSDNLGGLYFYANNGTTSYCQITATANEYRVAAQSTAVQTFYTNGSERMRIDSSGNLLVTNPAGLGYGTGSGGTVTQATSKSTGVTLNKPTGQITMNNAALAANTTVRFLVTNSVASVTDCIMVTIRDGVTAGAYQAWVDGTANGSFTMAVRNITAGSLSDAIVLNFAIIKGATS